MTDNRQTINENRLKTIATLAKRSMDLLVNDDKDDILSKPKSNSELKSFNSDLNDVIMVKMRKRFGL